MNNKILWFGAIFLSVLLLFSDKAWATGYTMTINVTGSGSVQQNPTNSIYPSGASVTLTAIPQDGWYFSGWSGDITGTNNPTNVLVESNLVITATFQPFADFDLTLTTNGQGTISLDPAGGVYASNTTVVITATPAAGWVFDSWSGNVSGNTNPLSITMTANVSVSGNFAQLPVFQEQPQSVTNGPGGTADFTSQAAGTPLVSYQWFFNNNSLTNATNSDLIITNLTLADTGNYQVVATNDYGSATSSVAALVLTNVVRSTNVVSVASEAALCAAIQQGGWVSITCNGTIILTNTIVVTNDVILDATGVSFALSGGNVLQLFYVAPGAMLSATNVVLEDGAVIVTNAPADGGAIYNDGGTVILTSCILTNNSAQNLAFTGVACGGAVFNNGGTLTLQACTVSDNTVAAGGTEGPFEPSPPGGLAFGGAIFATNGSVTIANCLISGNFCTATGGINGACFGGAAFLAANSVLISGSTFTNNLALGDAPPQYGEGPTPAAPAYGGALATISGTVVIDLSKFAGNTAQGGNAGIDSPSASGFGGAVYSTCALNIECASFSGNQALPGANDYPYGNPNPIPGGYGGGLYNVGEAILNQCSLYSNNVEGATPVYYMEPGNGGGGFGAGILNAGTIAITNCTIALNSAITGSGTTGFFGGIGINGAALGGGLFNSTNAICTMMNDTIASNSCIIVGNQGTNGLAAGVQIANTNGTLELDNTIIAYGGTNGNAYGVITDEGFNISSDGSANFQSGSSYNFTDPHLGPLGNYGGPTLCMALLPDSPAIGFGSSLDAPPVDQRGYPRPSGDVDIGACQYYCTSQNVGPQLSASLVVNGVLISYTAPAFASYCLQVSTNLTAWTAFTTNGPYLTSTNVTQFVNSQGEGPHFFRLQMQ